MAGPAIQVSNGGLTIGWFCRSPDEFVAFVHIRLRSRSLSFQARCEHNGSGLLWISWVTGSAPQQTPRVLGTWLDLY